MTSKPTDMIRTAFIATLQATHTSIDDNTFRVILHELRSEADTHGEHAVRSALRRCIRECKHRVTLADILERMPSGARMPDADAAW